MKTKKSPLLIAGAAFALGVALSQAQERPPLPFEVGETDARVGVNSFGAPQPVPEIQSHEVCTPDLEGIIADPPIGPRRFYVDIRYYGCRPWLIHPYTGLPIPRHELIRSIATNNPAWEEMAGNMTMEELLQPRDELGGEAFVSIEEGGIVDETNPEAIREFEDMDRAERENALAAGVTLAPGVNNISYAPYYGLYCLKVRLCIPYRASLAGIAYRYWLRWPYRLHQGSCWNTWWWSCWRNGWHGHAIYPCRPWLTPYTRWTRVGPDWVWHVSSVNRYRYWCLYGLRYYCTRFGTPVAHNPLPYVGQLGLHLQPAGAVTPWLRPWPYPYWRYWAYRPYCTRWYWFRPIPWFNYRYLPPVVQCAFAVPKSGGGFTPGPVPTDDNNVFPVEPPRVAAVGFEQEAPAGSYFNDNFVIDQAITARPLVRPLGDHNFDGLNTNEDSPRNIRIEERGHAAPIDLNDMDVPPVVGGGGGGVGA